jgi:hypothetical protein
LVEEPQCSPAVTTAGNPTPLSSASLQLIDASARGEVSGVFAPSVMLGYMLASDVSDLLAFPPVPCGNPSGVPTDISATELQSRHPDIWIGYTGASYHSTAHLLGCINKCTAGSSSIGSTGKAVQATCTVDIPGHFVKQDGTLGSTETLTEVGLGLMFLRNSQEFLQIP